MDRSTRRRFLQMSGIAGAIGLSGCQRRFGGEKVSDTDSEIEDTDDDGVIDSEDYAPRDPEVQRKEQLECDTSTATFTSDWISIPVDRSTWNCVTGSWTFDGTVLRQTRQIPDSNADTGNVYFYQGDEIQDGVYEAEVNSVDGDDGQSILFRKVRRDDAYEYYRFGFANVDSRQKIIISRTTRPVSTEEAAGGESLDYMYLPTGDVDYSLSRDTFYSLRVEFEGDSIRAYFEDTMVFDMRDDEYTEPGELGIHCGSRTEFRNLRYRRM